MSGREGIVFDGTKEVNYDGHNTSWRDKYDLVAEVGAGSLVSVYEVKNKRSKWQGVLKIAQNSLRNNSDVTREIAVLQRLSGAAGFPQLKDYGCDTSERAGLNWVLETTIPGRTFKTQREFTDLPLKTKFQIFKSYAERIRTAWSKGILLYDYKLNSFLWDEKVGVGVADLNVVKVIPRDEVEFFPFLETIKSLSERMEQVQLPFSDEEILSLIHGYVALVKYGIKHNDKYSNTLFPKKRDRRDEVKTDMKGKKWTILLDEADKDFCMALGRDSVTEEELQTIVADPTTPREKIVIAKNILELRQRQITGKLFWKREERIYALKSSAKIRAGIVANLASVFGVTVGVTLPQTEAKAVQSVMIRKLCSEFSPELVNLGPLLNQESVNLKENGIKITDNWDNLAQALTLWVNDNSSHPKDFFALRQKLAILAVDLERQQNALNDKAVFNREQAKLRDFLTFVSDVVGPAFGSEVVSGTGGEDYIEVFSQKKFWMQVVKTVRNTSFAAALGGYIAIFQQKWKTKETFSADELLEKFIALVDEEIPKYSN